MLDIIFISNKLYFKICIYIDNWFIININDNYFIVEMPLNVYKYIKNCLLDVKFYIYNFNNIIQYILIIDIYIMLWDIKCFIHQNNIKINVDRTFSLDEAGKALDYQKDVHPRGKVVITIWKRNVLTIC